MPYCECLEAHNKAYSLSYSTEAFLKKKRADIRQCLPYDSAFGASFVPVSLTVAKWNQPNYSRKRDE